MSGSHEAIIDPATYERVQRELSRRRSARPKKAGMDSPFANRLVCGACGAYYGHKVWRSRGKNKNRYDVWYCNHRYSGDEKCDTPTVREEDIQAAFVKAMKLKDGFTEELWRGLVEQATIYEDGRIEFQLTDGKTVSQKLEKSSKSRLP